MRNFRLILGTLLIATMTAAFAQTTAAPSITLVNQERWTAGTGPLAGSQVAVLAGDPSKAGEYTVRVKIPANTTLSPHYHNETEMVTVISGTLWVGLGDTVQQSQMKALPAGSFAMMPAQVHHYAMTKEPTVIQITGTGPMTMNMLKM